ASEMFEATRPGGEILLANTQFETGEPLLRTSIIRTYRDLFLNVGYELTGETIFPGEKHGDYLEGLMTLYRKPAPTAGASSGSFIHPSANHFIDYVVAIPPWIPGFTTALSRMNPNLVRQWQKFVQNMIEKFP